MTRLIKHSVYAIMAAIMLSACQTTAGAQPAKLLSNDAQTLSQLKTVLGQSLGRSDIQFSKSDPNEKSVITVLPKRHLGNGRLQTQDFAMPIIFDLIKEGTKCYAINRGTEEKIRLSNIPCTVITP